ncbi:retrovirus-related pol polyprotein from transposon TNT 1-94 [Tanacetum coccineum]
MEIQIKTCLMPHALKTQNDSFAFVHELKQEMHADSKYVESLEDEIDGLESDKAEFSNMYDILLQECVSNDIMCSYLQSSSDLDEITELQCFYLHKVRECDCLAQKLYEQTEFKSSKPSNFLGHRLTVRTDRGTEFLNKTLNAFFKEEGIEHQTSTPRTPEQNSVVERRNCTLVEAARTMLSASKLPLFFWAKAIETACYTQNRSIIIPTHEKMAYDIINDRKPSIKHLYIFGCTCYLTRDGENLDKIKEKGDPCILVGHTTQSKGYHIYNKRRRLIVESIYLRFDEIKEMSKTSVANDTSSLVPPNKKLVVRLTLSLVVKY